MTARRLAVGNVSFPPHQIPDFETAIFADGLQRCDHISGTAALRKRRQPPLICDDSSVDVIYVGDGVDGKAALHGFVIGRHHDGYQPGPDIFVEIKGKTASKQPRLHQNSNGCFPSGQTGRRHPSAKPVNLELAPLDDWRTASGSLWQMPSFPPCVNLAVDGIFPTGGGRSGKGFSKAFGKTRWVGKNSATRDGTSRTWLTGEI
jgi:hypothetical protein